MKTTLFTSIGFSFTLAVSSSYGQAPGTVWFDNRVTGTVVAKVTDVDGTTGLSGTNFWAQLYSADGLTAAADQLSPAAVSVNFKTSGLAGFVQTSGSNALGQAINHEVPVSSFDGRPASVQMRAWAGPFTSYEAAKTAGGKIGESRILRLSYTGGPATPPPYLTDSNGPMAAFSLSGLSVLSIADIVVSEGTNGNINATFSVRLAPQSTQTVTVAYATVDGTATAGSDYFATNGTLTFLPGETNKFITVILTPDVPAEPDENFLVVLTNATNAVIIRDQATCTITAEILLTGLSVDVTVTFNTVPGRTYTLEKTANPQSGNWTSVSGASNVLGTGSIVTVFDKGAGCNPTSFYRVRIIQ